MLPVAASGVWVCTDGSKYTLGLLSHCCECLPQHLGSSDSAQVHVQGKTELQVLVCSHLKEVSMAWKLRKGSPPSW